jgi:DNA-binding NarL/FixJ family response regulator
MSAERQARDNISPCRLDAASQEEVRLLLVDDSELARENIGRFLQSCHRVNVVATAVDGYDALEAVRRHRPDLVLMDVQMPRMNGVKAAAQIRKEFPSTRIVLFSSHDYVGLRALVESNGGDAFVPKSCLTKQFCDVLQQLFGSCSEEPASELLANPK